MARKPLSDAETPATPTQSDGSPAVTDMPPANPFEEPLEEPDAYSDGEGAELTAGTLKPAETIVEHPLSPTDTNPNPHGNRSVEQTFNIVVDKDTKIGARTNPEQDVEVEGLADGGVHIGDGRVLAKGETMKIGKDAAKQLVADKQVKRV